MFLTFCKVFDPGVIHNTLQIAPCSALAQFYVMLSKYYYKHLVFFFNQFFLFSVLQAHFLFVFPSFFIIFLCIFEFWHRFYINFYINNLISFILSHVKFYNFFLNHFWHSRYNRRKLDAKARKPQDSSSYRFLTLIYLTEGILCGFIYVMTIQSIGFEQNIS